MSETKIEEIQQTQAMRFQVAFVVLCICLARTNVSYSASIEKITPKGSISFTSRGQRFAVWLPVKPVQDKQTFTMKNGKIATIFTYEAHSQGVGYLIVSSDLAGFSKKARGGLDDAQKNFVRTSGATIEKSRNFQMGQFGGRELRAKTFMDNLALTRMYETPRFFYQIVARGEKAPMQKQSAQIKRVFDSFRILRK